EYWINPLLGALSVLLVYAAASREATHWIAFGLAAIWGAGALLAFYSIDVMSDVPATVAILATYLLIRQKRIRAAGIILGLSLMIRPMNLLFLGPAVLLLPKRRRPLSEFAAVFAAGALTSAWTQFHLWGGLLSPDYHANVRGFRLENLPLHLPGYAR